MCVCVCVYLPSDDVLFPNYSIVAFIYVCIKFRIN